MALVGDSLMPLLMERWKQPIHSRRQNSKWRLRNLQEMAENTMVDSSTVGINLLLTRFRILLIQACMVKLKLCEAVVVGANSAM